MPEYNYNNIKQEIEQGIKEALQCGDLSHDGDGYCFYCDKDKPLLTASSEFPTQPPLCQECLVKLGIHLHTQGLVNLNQE